MTQQGEAVLSVGKSHVGAGEGFDAANCFLMLPDGSDLVLLWNERARNDR